MFKIKSVQPKYTVIKRIVLERLSSHAITPRKMTLHPERTHIYIYTCIYSIYKVVYNDLPDTLVLGKTSTGYDQDIMSTYFSLCGTSA
jgi:hypothetical protein